MIPAQAITPTLPPFPKRIFFQTGSFLLMFNSPLSLSGFQPLSGFFVFVFFFYPAFPPPDPIPPRSNPALGGSPSEARLPLSLFFFFSTPDKAIIFLFLGCLKGLQPAVQTTPQGGTLRISSLGFPDFGPWILFLHDRGLEELFEGFPFKPVVFPRYLKVLKVPPLALFTSLGVFWFPRLFC